MNHENSIDSELLSKMLVRGYNNLLHNIEYLNEINVFPVSDSDTGTNMKNTFAGGITALTPEPSFSGTFSTFVKGMLVRSRGNSGFILSQFFLGIHEYTKGKDTVTVTDLSSALPHAYQKAYKAMLKPVEGTMLTVMHEGIKRTLPRINGETSIIEFFDIMAGEMFICVKETLNQMDMLRDNNVLDSGAVGLYLIFDGMKRALRDDMHYFDCRLSNLPERRKIFVKNVSFFRYCTEFILSMHDAGSKDYFAGLLAKRGDSIAVSADEGVLKVHIHTNEPQDLMDEFSKYGEFTAKKIDDLFQTQEFEVLKLRKHSGFAIVAFTYGDGNAATLEQLGADLAFSVPCDHHPTEKGLAKLLDEFLKENLIVFPDNKETYEKLKNIQRFSNLQNLYIADSEGLSKTLFMLSSLIFTDGFKDVIKSLESLKKRQVFQTSIRAAIKDNQVQYTGILKGENITGDNIFETLNLVADKKTLEPYSTVVVFGGKYCKQKDIDDIRIFFEENGNIEFTYLDGLQHDCDFIIGAY
ncbi:MAG: DAK2 domain-containing protein [Treponema sp.]|nr:DAK2 domain-containing protein [Treponema sp.]